MYLLRRHSRRLLLPPGWVALGFLLLLGCQVLLLDKRLRPKNILQLTMLMLDRKAAEKYGANIPEYCFCKPLTYIKSTTRWQNAQIVGNALNFSINRVALEAAVRAIQADKGHARGVRVYFLQNATYGSLVSLLDMIQRLDQKAYWLDVEHQPVTFYAINEKAVKSKRSPEAVY